MHAKIDPTGYARRIASHHDPGNRASRYIQDYYKDRAAGDQNVLLSLPLATVMRKRLTGYAVSFNRRHIFPTQEKG